MISLVLRLSCPIDKRWSGTVGSDSWSKCQTYCERTLITFLMEKMLDQEFEATVPDPLHIGRD